MIFVGVPVPKPKFKRRKPKRGSQTRITPKVREEVLRRSSGCCERCGKHSSWGMEMAHLQSAAQGGSGGEEWNVVLLCGPSTDSKTCHHFADHSKAGREWRIKKRKQLEKYYGISE